MEPVGARYSRDGVRLTIQSHDNRGGVHQLEATLVAEPGLGALVKERCVLWSVPGELVSFLLSELFVYASRGKCRWHAWGGVRVGVGQEVQGL